MLSRHEVWCSSPTPFICISTLILCIYFAVMYSSNYEQSITSADINDGICSTTFDAPLIKDGGFVKTRDIYFELDEKPFYFNGFNAYWLMLMATDPSTRHKVIDTFSQASRVGMTVARTWAFSDGGDWALQTSPGVYNEDMFKGLDFVISEAKKYSIRLILSLVNNWDDYGGKKQYVQWANRYEKQHLKNEDDFFRNPIVKGFYKNHIKAVLTRNNSISGVAYKDDSTIFAWELMNEPRCNSDLSGKSIQDWVAEMSAYVKLIDQNHLLEIGLEGFYRECALQKQLNPSSCKVGTDFIANNDLPFVDFTTIHLYPDLWILDPTEDAQRTFVDEWNQQHIDDSKSILKKPLILSEFGFTTAYNDNYVQNIYNSIFNCAKDNGPCGGALFWEVMALGDEIWGDRFDVVLGQNSSIDALIYQQSMRFACLNNNSLMVMMNKSRLIWDY